MKVILAGFNVDVEALKEYRAGKAMVTPESIPAAYARISRSPKPVTILRKEAREEVDKARKSNRAIIFEMGHHSVAEHAVFNFDVLGISRRAVEELEQFRLCSYTEKSQRYVTLKGDFVVPKELKKTALLNEYVSVIKLQNDFYKRLFVKLREYNFKKNSRLAKHKKGQRFLENLAKEDARYILPMATQTQLGATINARNLELMMRRFASHRLREINELGKKFFNLVKEIAPSIILFYTANDYDRKTYPMMREYANRLSFKTQNIKPTQDVDLLYYTRDADSKILASLLFRVTENSYSHCEKMVTRMPKRAKNELFKKSCKNMELYDVVLREFEFADLTYSLTVSAACFGQLKRHRMATITCQEYDPHLGYTMPSPVKDIGEEKGFSEIIRKAEKVYQKIRKRFPDVASYILTNAHRKRVLVHMNLRELYHISRLREDPTAQWDIRDKVCKMSALAKRVMPMTTQLLAGKTDYPNRYCKLFNTMPKVTRVPEPGD